MNKNKLFYVLIVGFISLFMFNLDVYAAKELTCLYGSVDSAKKGRVLLTQDSKGVRRVYINSENVEIKTETNYWIAMKEEAYAFFDETLRGQSMFQIVGDEKALISYDKSGNLISCPKSNEVVDKKNIDLTKIWFYANNHGESIDDGYSEGQKLINQFNSLKTPTLGKEEVKELTCVYKMGNEDRKIAITQDKDGLIKIYENKENVDIDDRTNYWTISSFEVKKNKSLADKSTYLTECPKSKTTDYTFGVNGQVTFYEDETGADAIEKSYDGIVDIQKKIDSTVGDSVGFDSDKIGKSCSQLGDASNKWLKDHDGYTLACLYENTIDNYRNEGKYCHVLQINIGKNGLRFYDSESSFYNAVTANSYQFYDNDITEEKVIEINGGECPTQLKVTRIETGIVNGVLGVDTRVSLDGGAGEIYSLVDGGASGKNLVTGAKASSKFSFSINFNEIKIENCEDLFGENSEQITNILKTLLTITKIAIPIILLVMGSLDFAQAVFSSNEDGIKKAQGKFIKRLIIAVVIFLIPSILIVLLELANSIWPSIDSTLCGILK